VRYIAGGRGMLSRLLNKRHNDAAEVVDPRGWVLRGVRHERVVLDFRGPKNVGIVSEPPSA